MKATPMKPFRFLQAALPAPRNMTNILEARFTSFLSAYRKRRFAGLSPFNAIMMDDDFDGMITLGSSRSAHDSYRLNDDDVDMITRRARRIVARMNAQSEGGHLTEDQVKRLQVATTTPKLVPVPNINAPDEIIDQLHREFPWMTPATDAVWQALRLSVSRGDSGLRIPPLLLDGPPGIGKTTWARRLGSLIGVPTGIIEATSEPASFALVGMQKGWTTAASGKPMDLILRTQVANPIFIIDEVEKAGRAMSHNGGVYDLAASLLPLLERESSKVWQCPYFQLPFDMSWISWILTANDASLLPAPLRSRVTVIDLPALTIEQIIDFMLKEGRRRDLSAPALDAAMIAMQCAATRHTMPSLRTALRALDRAEALQARPMLH